MPDQVAPPGAWECARALQEPCARKDLEHLELHETSTGLERVERQLLGHNVNVVAHLERGLVGEQLFLDAADVRADVAHVRGRHEAPNQYAEFRMEVTNSAPGRFPLPRQVALTRLRSPDRWLRHNSGTRRGASTGRPGGAGDGTGGGVRDRLGAPALDVTDGTTPRIVQRTRRAASESRASPLVAGCLSARWYAARAASRRPRACSARARDRS